MKNTKKITNIDDYTKEVDKIIATGKPIVEQFMDLMGLLDVSFVDTTVNEKNSIPDYISECCKAPVIAVSGILDTDTFHFECLKCRKACNPIKRPKKQDSSVHDRRVKLTKSDSIQKRISTGIDMSRDGSQTKRKRDATTGSTVKAHLDWEKEFELWCDVTEVDRVSRESMKGFITTELLGKILEHNKDEMTSLYDFDGIALEVISLVKK